MPYLTPDSNPSETVTVTFDIPDSDEWVAFLYGALLELTRLENWEEYGSISEDETASTWDDIVQSVSIT